MKITAAMTTELRGRTGQLYTKLQCLYALQLCDGDMKRAAFRLSVITPFTVEQEVAIRCIVLDELTKFATTLKEANVRKD